MPRILSCLLILFSVVLQTSGQKPVRWTSGEVYEGIQKLRVLGSALYVAAHPDDENTRLISHLANDVKVRTAYLSLTRGDGGQNLIGPEIGPLLGVIRTQELLRARGTDHGEQWFSRAIDFGYSKTPDETLEIWNHDAVLSDVIRVIRTVQPDVIINRFSAEPTPGNHGHHVASAILSTEAFEKAGNSGVCSEQLSVLSVWKPSRILFNTSWWFYGSRENFARADKSSMVQIEVGRYNPLTGKSNTEIAAESRSMHKSQGFGSSGSRGFETEYLELLAGSVPGDMSDLFDGIDISWNRLPGGGPIDQMLAQVEKSYDFQRPHMCVEGLVNVRRAIQRLDDSHWKTKKLEEIDFVIAQAMGLYLEVAAVETLAAPGDSFQVLIEVINRSPLKPELIATHYTTVGMDLRLHGTLDENARISETRTLVVPSSQETTCPYWLTHPPGTGLYAVDDPELRGLPETPRAAFVRFELGILDDTISYRVPIIYKKTDPVDGEVYRPFEVVPPVFVNLSAPVYLFTQDNPATVTVRVQATTSEIEGLVRLQVPEGWSVEPEAQPVSIGAKGQESELTFSVAATGESASEGQVTASVEVEGRTYDLMVTDVDYPHIPPQKVLSRASARAVRIDLQRGGNRIAYLQGAGDDVASSLQQIGYAVDFLEPSDITGKEILRQYDAVVLGIRAYNTLERLSHVQKYLFDYANDGGTLVTQYNTTSGLQGTTLAPFPIHVSRQRVTDETAEVTFLDPGHRVLNAPNKLTAKDFEGWVQERGLYFPDSWDPAFIPLLGMADPGEDQLQGGLLVAAYGKGHIVYTGLSFFRQLPEGVPGAYRLFANLLALSEFKRS